MSRDLGFNGQVIGLGIGIFFFNSYVALQVPGAILVERWSARRSRRTATWWRVCRL